MPENHFRRHAFDSKIIQSAVVTTGSFMKKKVKGYLKKCQRKKLRHIKPWPIKKKKDKKTNNGQQINKIVKANQI